MGRAPKLLVALTVVCVVSALSLSAVNDVTKTLIEEQDTQARLRAVRAVLPPFDNDPIADTTQVAAADEPDGEMIVVHVGKKAGKPTGVAFEVTGEGYGGRIRVMLGMDVKGCVSGVRILKHAETPGLGAKIEEDAFTSAFRNKSLANSRLVRGELAVKKDGGDIDAVTGATISSRGVTEAVSWGLKLFEARKGLVVPAGK
jgi:electron transport complex protein RnfG